MNALKRRIHSLLKCTRWTFHSVKHTFPIIYSAGVKTPLLENPPTWETASEIKFLGQLSFKVPFDCCLHLAYLYRCEHLGDRVCQYRREFGRLFCFIALLYCPSVSRCHACEFISRPKRSLQFVRTSVGRDARRDDTKRAGKIALMTRTEWVDGPHGTFRNDLGTRARESKHCKGFLWSRFWCTVLL